MACINAKERDKKEKQGIRAKKRKEIKAQRVVKNRMKNRRNREWGPQHNYPMPPMTHRDHTVSLFFYNPPPPQGR